MMMLAAAVLFYAVLALIYLPRASKQDRLEAERKQHDAAYAERRKEWERRAQEASDEIRRGWHAARTRKA
jgi:hypothetical protein